MSYYIGPTGPRTAKLAIVAEKPGRDELERLQRTGSSEPLIGASGRQVDSRLLKIGTCRQDVYITNAVKHFDTLGNPTTKDIQAEQLSLYRELLSLPNLNCILTLGNAALLSLTNFHYGDIGKRRGSVLRSFIGTKMVPTYHPAFYMRGQWELAPVVEFDMKRALDQSAFPDMRHPERTFYIEPTFKEATEWLRYLRGRPQISFDIELARSGLITCIAFSDKSDVAYCIPLRRGNRQSYWTVEEECTMWRLIEDVLTSKESEFITQNGLFDCWHLYRHGIYTPWMGYGFDTMYAHRLLAPELPHDLAFLVSIYTDEPYYKDESGSWSSDIPVPDKQFWVYNCKDSACTLEVAQVMQQDMAEADMLEYYKLRVQARWPALVDMRMRGMRVHRERLIEQRQTLLNQRNALEGRLTEMVGWMPNVKSWKDMGKLFEQFNVRYTSTPTGRPKSDAESLHKYARWASGTAREVLVLCGDVVETRTLASNFVGMALDEHDFYHPALDLEKTKTGRDASEGSPAGGPQIQNIPKPIRRLFIPDDDDSEITCADQKQAEAMYVAWDARDPLLMRTFIEGRDVHRVRACVVYRDWRRDDLPPDDLLASIKVVCDKCAQAGEKECNHSERYTAKQAGHAFSYKMGTRKYVSIQAKKNLFVEEYEAERIKNRIVSRHIIAWQNRVANELRETGWLANEFGRRREFYGLFDEEMIRAALSWKAQSYVAEINKDALMFLYKHLPAGARLLTQTHDSVVISNKRSQREYIDELINKAYDITKHIHGTPLKIPVDITHGPSWGEQK